MNFFKKTLSWDKYLNYKNIISNAEDGTSLVAQLVKNPPAMQEILVRFMNQEDPLEKG